MKRPIMGSIAAEHADISIVTSDNPRTEDPEDNRGCSRGSRKGKEE